MLCSSLVDLNPSEVPEGITCVNVLNFRIWQVGGFGIESSEKGRAT